MHHNVQNSAMTALRAIAVGLMAGVWIMLEGYVSAAQWFISSQPNYALWLAIETVSPAMSGAVDVGLVFAAGYTVACLSMGLILSSLVYPALEGWLRKLIRFAPKPQATFLDTAGSGAAKKTEAV